MRDNRTKRIMRSGGLALGVSLTIPDPFVTEVVGGAGFDFVLIDAEHSPIAIDQLQMMLIALRSSESTVLVRPAANDPALIKQILDLGAEGLVVPEVDDAAACAAAVAAARYPPLGQARVRAAPGRPPRRRQARLPRPGRRRGGGARHDRERRRRRPASTPYSRPPAWTGSWSARPTSRSPWVTSANSSHPDVRAAITGVRDACQRHSVPFGIFAGTEQAAREWWRGGGAGS